ncbi:M48 family metalloprotease [Phytohalomonas tamaricis]|uniref:M48 family metalloprotease n=1 Tax=Phytohalomonas tamaricis TaxID=2081032 RepID=UPI0021D42801|nr:M48 family metalloprotease [Phytohalomonas tamaricis]
MTLLSAPSVPAESDYGLPALGEQTVTYAGMNEERLGRAWLRQFRAQTGQWSDPITQHYLESIVARLVPNSNLGDIHPTVVLVASRMLNAFAVPGGVVGVNTGLFLFAPDRDAFASVLAHELGHLSQHHFARQMQQAESSQLPTMAALLAGMIIAAGGGGGDFGVATIAGTQAAFLQNQLAYSRQYEEEADRVGLEALARAGMDPQAMPRMFRAMQRIASLQGNSPPEFLLTHPLTESRINYVQARANQLHVKEAPPGPEYDMVRARAMLAINMSAPSQAQIRLKQDTDDPFAFRYLDALIDSVQNRPDQALAKFDKLAAEQPDLLMIPASAADAALDANRRQEALDRARRILRFAPNYYPARMTEGEALLTLDPSQAFNVLRKLADERPEDPDVWNLLAEAAGRSGRKAWGHLAMGERMQLNGRLDSALKQLDYAEKAADDADDFTMKSRIRDRRNDFQRYRDDLDQF